MPSSHMVRSINPLNNAISQIGAQGRVDHKQSVILNRLGPGVRVQASDDLEQQLKPINVGFRVVRLPEEVLSKNLPVVLAFNPQKVASFIEMVASQKQVGNVKMLLPSTDSSYQARQPGACKNPQN